jgi:TonB-dependent SusC/RagA subfamily outer membrane receptor
MMMRTRECGVRGWWPARGAMARRAAIRWLGRALAYGCVLIVAADSARAQPARQAAPPRSGFTVPRPLTPLPDYEGGVKPLLPEIVPPQAPPATSNVRAPVATSEGGAMTPDFEGLVEAEVLHSFSGLTEQSSLLYVIDGVVVSPRNESFDASTLIQHRSIRRFVDPRNIAAMDVLKGAAAAALYGSAAANGVVVITTRRGRTGPAQATVVHRVGFAQPANRLRPRVFNAIDEVRAIACHQGDTPESCDAEPLVMAYRAANGRVYDHEAELLRSATLVETLGTIAGGSANAVYQGSVVYRDRPSIVVGVADEELGGRMELSYRLGARARLGVSASVSRSIAERGILSTDEGDVPLYNLATSTPSFVDAKPLRLVSLVKDRAETVRRSVVTTLGVDVYARSDGASTIKLLASAGVDRLSWRRHAVSPRADGFELITDDPDRSTGNRSEGSEDTVRTTLGAGALWTSASPDRGIRSALSAALSFRTARLSSSETSQRVFVTDLYFPPYVESGFRVKEVGAMSKGDTAAYLQEEVVMMGGRLSLVAGVLAERSALNGYLTEYHLYPKVSAVYSLVGPDDDEGQGLLKALRVRAARADTGKLSETTNGVFWTELLVPEGAFGLGRFESSDREFGQNRKEAKVDPPRMKRARMIRSSPEDAG